MKKIHNREGSRDENGHERDVSFGPYMSFFHSFNTNLYFIDYINTPIHRIILKYITMYYVDFEIEFDPLFTL